MYSQPLSVATLAMGPDDYDGTTAYARAKRAQVTLAQMWAEYLRPDEVAVHADRPLHLDNRRCVWSVDIRLEFRACIENEPAAASNRIAKYLLNPPKL